MAERVLTGLGALVALVVGFMPDLVPAGTVTLVMVIGGIVYVALAVDASDAGGFLITAIAIATLSGSGAVGSIPRHRWRTGRCNWSPELGPQRWCGRGPSDRNLQQAQGLGTPLAPSRILSPDDHRDPESNQGICSDLGDRLTDSYTRNTPKNPGIRRHFAEERCARRVPGT